MDYEEADRAILRKLQDVPETEGFDAAQLIRVGLKQDPDYPKMFRIPGTGWRIYEATDSHSGYPYGFDHDDEGKEYGEVDSLAVALAAVLDAEKTGYGDRLGLQGISIPAIQRIIDNLNGESA